MPFSPELAPKDFASRFLDFLTRTIMHTAMAAARANMAIATPCHALKTGAKL
jgi:hypothetical protein